MGDVTVSINSDKFERNLYNVSLLIVISFLDLTQHILYTTKELLFIVNGYILKDYVCHHWYLRNTLRVYALGLGSIATPRNLLEINVEG